jgi:hypothetical protein
VHDSACASDQSWPRVCSGRQPAASLVSSSLGLCLLKPLRIAGARARYKTDSAVLCFSDGPPSLGISTRLWLPVIMIGTSSACSRAAGSDRKLRVVEHSNESTRRCACGATPHLPPLVLNASASAGCIWRVMQEPSEEDKPMPPYCSQHVFT